MIWTRHEVDHVNRLALEVFCDHLPSFSSKLDMPPHQVGAIRTTCLNILKAKEIDQPKFAAEASS